MLTTLFAFVLSAFADDGPAVPGRCHAPPVHPSAHADAVFRAADDAPEEVFMWRNRAIWEWKAHDLNADTLIAHRCDAMERHKYYSQEISRLETRLSELANEIRERTEGMYWEQRQLTILYQAQELRNQANPGMYSNPWLMMPPPSWDPDQKKLDRVIVRLEKRMSDENLVLVRTTSCMMGIERENLESDLLRAIDHYRWWANMVRWMEELLEKAQADFQPFDPERPATCE